jgi:ribosomal protein L11
MVVKLSLGVKGKVNCGNPIGPILAPYGIDINKAVDEINKVIEPFEDMQVKVNIEINLKKRDFKISLPKPKITDLIRHKSKEGKITKSQIVQVIYAIYKEDMKNINIDKKTSEIEGTCKSMHIEVI